MISNAPGLQNSIITCRHTPQGGVRSVSAPSGPPTMQIARNCRAPSLTALKKAVRSAQLEGP